MYELLAKPVLVKASKTFTKSISRELTSTIRSIDKLQTTESCRTFHLERKEHFEALSRDLLCRVLNFRLSIEPLTRKRNTRATDLQVEEIRGLMVCIVHDRSRSLSIVCFVHPKLRCFVILVVHTGIAPFAIYM